MLWAVARNAINSVQDIGEIVEMLSCAANLGSMWLGKSKLTTRASNQGVPFPAIEHLGILV